MNYPVVNDLKVEHYHCVECNTTQPKVEAAEVSETGGITEAGLDVCEVSRECSWCNRPGAKKED